MKTKYFMETVFTLMSAPGVNFISSFYVRKLLEGGSWKKTALCAKEQNWIILNFKTGHGLFNETQNFAIAKQKIRNDLHVNSLFIVSLFVYLAHILFKLILKRGNISNKCHIELQCLLEGSAYFNVDTQWYGTFETHHLKILL